MARAVATTCVTIYKVPLITEAFSGYVTSTEKDMHKDAKIMLVEQKTMSQDTTVRKLPSFFRTIGNTNEKRRSVMALPISDILYFRVLSR